MRSHSDRSTPPAAIASFPSVRSFARATSPDRTVGVSRSAPVRANAAERNAGGKFGHLRRAQRSRRRRDVCARTNARNEAEAGLHLVAIVYEFTGSSLARARSVVQKGRL